MRTDWPISTHHCIGVECAGVRLFPPGAHPLPLLTSPIKAKKSGRDERETPWPVLATRPTMIHEEGRTARLPRVLTDQRG